MSEYHTSVLLDESVSALIGSASGIYADATFGGGGHTSEILRRLSPEGRVIAFDRDSDAIANRPDDSRLTLIRSDFRWIHNHILHQGYAEGIDGVLADLGVSSHQFDTAERGFSFRYEAPLDMRMNTQAKKDARTIINEYEEEEIARLLKLYGEVDNSRKVASLICSARSHSPITTTGELTEAIKKVLPPVAESGGLCFCHFCGGICHGMAAADMDRHLPVGLRGQFLFRQGIHPAGLCAPLGDFGVIF